MKAGWKGERRDESLLPCIEGFLEIRIFIYISSIPQQPSKDDHPYFKNETYEAQSLSNVYGDTQLVGCRVRIWNQVCVTQQSAAFYHSMLHLPRLPEVPIPPALSSPPSLSDWGRINKLGVRVSGKTLGSQLLLPSAVAKHFPTGHISSPRRCWRSDRCLLGSEQQSHF